MSLGKLVLVLHLLLMRRLYPANGNSTDSGSTDLYVLVLSPYPDPVFKSKIGWTGGPALFPAAQLAADMINDRPDMLQEFTLRLINGDSGCDFYTQATLTFARQARLAEQNPVIGIVGPACTTAAITIGGITAERYSDVVSITIANGPLLDNESEFRNMFRLFSTATISAHALVQLMKYAGWTSVAAVVDFSHVFRYPIYDSFSEILDASENYTAQMLPFQGAVPFGEIRNTYNVIFVFASAQDSVHTICLALKLDFRFPDYQWVFVDMQVERVAVNVTSDYDGTMYNCTEEEMRKAAHQIIIFQLRLFPEDMDTVSYSGLSFNAFFTEYEVYYEKHLREENISRDDVHKGATNWAAPYFDSLWALGLALNMSTPTIRNENATHHEKTRAIHSSLLSLRFPGLTRDIYFRTGSQDTPSILDMYQLMAHKEAKKIGYYHEETLHVTGNASFVDPIKMELVVVRFGAVAFFFPAGLIIFALFATLHVVYIVFRRYQSIHAQSPEFTHLLFSGCYLFVLSALLETVRAANWTGFSDINSDAFKVVIGTLCNVIFWCLTLSASLIFGTMCVLSWRIYRIFTHFLDPGKLISDPVLAGMVGALLTVNVTVLVAWSSYDPLLPHFVATNEGLRAGVLPFYVYCDCEHFFEWLLIWALNELVILLVLLLAILNRHVPKKDFINNTRSHTWTVYIMSFITGLCIPIYFLLSVSNRINTSYVFFQIFTLGSPLSAFILLFLPPVIPLLRNVKLKLCNQYN